MSNDKTQPIDRDIRSMATRDWHDQPADVTLLQSEILQSIYHRKHGHKRIWLWKSPRHARSIDKR